MSAAPLVTLDHVDVDLAGAPVLRDVTWQLARGEHWGIVGANGSGKSTLLGLIAGTIWPAPERGTRRYDFGDGTETDAVRARSEIVLVGHELQDRYARLELELHGARHRAVGHLSHRRAAPQARGRRARAGARCSATARRRGARAAQVSRALARRAASRVDRARRRVRSDGAAARRAGERPRSRRAQRACRDARARRRASAPSCALRTYPTICRTLVERYLEIAAGRVIAHERNVRGRHRRRVARTPRRARAHTPDVAAQPLIALEHADVWLAGRRVLHDVTWRLMPGEHWLVTGANGSGKSSFLRCLYGALRPAFGGRCRWPALGNPRDVWQLRQSVAWVSPELQAAYRYPSTVRACIASGFTSSVGASARRRRATEAARVDATARTSSSSSPSPTGCSSTLSYGQARRALLGRVLANRPRVLLLDEPWEGLDAPMAQLLNETLARVTADGTQLVCASHLETHRAHFTHELVLDAGRVVRAGPTRAR